ncbi:MAG: filamentous hemagglutinin N-terminal domain-containing protein, partial [Candidatus Omnitrophica bacterium]|nr:filamentous hemagglutinin N-terminal domain-containing protein [Candidatus Omnitrophota bacterium]
MLRSKWQKIGSRHDDDGRRFPRCSGGGFQVVVETVSNRSRRFEDMLRKEAIAMKTNNLLMVNGINRKLISYLNRIVAILLVITFASSQVVYPLPQDPQIEEGTATIHVDGSTMTINAQDKTVINYSSFNIGANEAVIVTLPNVNSSILNRDIGGSVSNLAGLLQSNGLFILINPAGIYVAPTANINVGSIVLSTRDINSKDFINSNYVFQKISREQLDALLLNAGTINITRGGFGVLIAGAVENKGIITAPVGKITLASGDAVKLDIGGDGLISVAIEEKAASKVYDFQGRPITDAIKNSGTLKADGGVVTLKAEALTDVFTKAINLEGLTQATTLDSTKGEVRLVSDGAIQNTGTINTNTLTEKGASFKASGTITGGDAYYDNEDGAMVINGPINIGSNQYDNGNIIINGAVTLIANNLTFAADNDNDRSGVFYMNTGARIDGGSSTKYNLTIKSGNTAAAGEGIDGQAPKLENISNIGTITFDKSTGSTPTYTSNSSAEFSVNTVKTVYGTKLSRDVTDGGYHMIYSVSDAPGGLQLMQNNLGWNYKLANDIDASETELWNGGAGFVPVGTFTGTFDGSGCEITGLYINRYGTMEPKNGLFGETSGATVRNVGLKSAFVKGGSQTGGLIGWMWGGGV